MHRCPHCSSTFVRLVRPTWLERARFRFTEQRPHECWHCGWRGWLSPDPQADPQAEPEADPEADQPAGRVPGERGAPSRVGAADPALQRTADSGPSSRSKRVSV